MRRSFLDAGASVPGRTACKDSGEWYRCSDCKRRQLESVLQRDRNRRVRCKWCGALSIAISDKPVQAEVRTCKKCWATLRRTNEFPVCSICLESLAASLLLRYRVQRNSSIHSVDRKLGFTVCGTPVWDISRYVWGVETSCKKCLKLEPGCAGKLVFGDGHGQE